MALCKEQDVRQLLVGVDLTSFIAALPTGITFAQLFSASERFVAQWMESYCHRTFETRRELRFLPGNDETILWAGVLPIQELHACKIRMLPASTWFEFQHFAYINVVDDAGNQVAVPSSSSEVSAADLYVSCTDGMLIIPPTIFTLATTTTIPGWNWTWRTTLNVPFPNVELDVTYGYSEATLPVDLARAAACLVACHLLPQIDAALGQGMRSWRIGDESRSWGGRAAGFLSDAAFAAFLYDGMYSALGANLLAQAATTVSGYRRLIV